MSKKEGVSWETQRKSAVQEMHVREERGAFGLFKDFQTTWASKFWMQL